MGHWCYYRQSVPAKGSFTMKKTVTVTIDRPLGTCHPNHPDIFYSVNYGYVEGIPAPDGDWQDVYVLGVDRPLEIFEGELIAVIHRRDDVEDKWVAAPVGVSFSAEEIRQLTFFQERFFDSEVKMV